MKLLEALDWRYAVKQFSDEKITAVELKSLLNATRLSASSYGLQPYNIIVVESNTIRKQLLPFSYGQEKVADSSHLIIFASHTQIGDVTVDRYIEKHAKQNVLRAPRVAFTRQGAGFPTCRCVIVRNCLPTWSRKPPSLDIFVRS